jgi:hypothetical protein
MTDELLSYVPIGRKDFDSRHTTVNHSANEYVRLGGFAHVNTAEARFRLMKRAVFGTHHSISEAHLLIPAQAAHHNEMMSPAVTE